MTLTSAEERILASLNASQRAAVEQIDGPLLILAGPGSGKTRVITHRIAWMIHQGIAPEGIAALTFTNKAADEMRSRLASLVPGAQVWSGTFHRFCSRLLRVYARYSGLGENFTIYDMEDSRKILKQAIAACDVDLRHYTPATLAHEISQLKNRGVLADQFQPRPGRYMDVVVAQVYPHYQRLMQHANAVDFDDLLLHAATMLEQNPELRAALDRRYTHMMVDEYQDTNLAQYRLIRLLNWDVRNLAVTGDPDQSIYGWRGANLGNILEFERDYPDVRIIRLEENYRSRQPILHVADQLISNNVRRRAKTLVATRGAGEPVVCVAYPNPQEEAEDIARQIAQAIRQEGRRPRDFAIFYRTNYLSRSLEHALRAQGIPYQILQGVEFYQRREIKDMMGWLHLLNNERDAVAFERVINVPPRKIGKATIDKLRAWSLERSGRTMLDACRQAAEVPGISRQLAVRLSAFVALYDRIGEWRHAEVATILRTVIRETGYRDWLIEDGSEESHERASNVDELVAAAAEFDRQHPQDGGLEAFLEQTALVSDTDDWDADSDFVTLLTIHSSKGLEFPFVYMVGLEDGILPHERSQGSEDEIEEERRVFFVGITRAMERLQISRCLTRFRNGSSWPTIGSRFLMELPRETMTLIEPSAMSAWDSEPEPWDELADEEVAADEFAAAGEAPLAGERDVASPAGRPLAGGGSGGENGLIWETATRQRGAAAANTQRGHKSKAAAAPTTGLPPGLVTAAALAAQQSQRTSLSVDQARVGAAVVSPEYGRGVIQAASGVGLKKTITVLFDREQTPRKFRVSHCNLQLADR